jgi:hypothetical protein
LANAGIARIVFGEFYRDERIFEAAKIARISLEWLKPEEPELPAQIALPEVK